MRVEPHAGQVRQLVLAEFQSLGEAALSLFELEETVVINGGQYLGRRYRTPRLTAVWLLDAGVVRFYDRRGKVLRTVNLFEELAPLRAAA